MIRYTDPRLLLSISGVSLADSTDIHVTFKQGNTILDITDVDVAENDLVVYLTQEQTKQFKMPPQVSEPFVKVQVNGLSGGKRWATGTAVINVEEQLLEVILDE